MFGTHTLIALGVAFVLRLSRLATLVGAYVSNPWTIGPMYLAGTMFGCLLFGVPLQGLSPDLFVAGDASTTVWPRLRPYLFPFVVGNLLLGAICGTGAYLVLRRVLERRRIPRPAPAVARD